MELTAEFGTLTARGVFAVAERRFVDRRLTRSELKEWELGRLFTVEDGMDADTVFSVAMLNRLKPKSTDQDVTVEWLQSSLTQTEIILLSAFIRGGPAGVRLILNQLQAHEAAQESESSPTPQT